MPYSHLLVLRSGRRRCLTLLVIITLKALSWLVPCFEELDNCSLFGLQRKAREVIPRSFKSSRGEAQSINNPPSPSALSPPTPLPKRILPMHSTRYAIMSHGGWISSKMSLMVWFGLNVATIFLAPSCSHFERDTTNVGAIVHRVWCQGQSLLTVRSRIQSRLSAVYRGAARSIFFRRHFFLPTLIFFFCSEI